MGEADRVSLATLIRRSADDLSKLLAELKRVA